MTKHSAHPRFDARMIGFDLGWTRTALRWSFHMRVPEKDAPFSTVPAGPGLSSTLICDMKPQQFR